MIAVVVAAVVKPGMGVGDAGTIGRVAWARYGRTVAAQPMHPLSMAELYRFKDFVEMPVAEPSCALERRSMPFRRF